MSTEQQIALLWWLQLRHADVELRPVCCGMIRVRAPLKYHLSARRDEMQPHKPVLWATLVAEGLPVGCCATCQQAGGMP